MYFASLCSSGFSTFVNAMAATATTIDAKLNMYFFISLDAFLNQKASEKLWFENNSLPTLVRVFGLPLARSGSLP